MATVGSDKRLSYYRQTPDEVLAELQSHRLGLTEPEAARRLQDHGLNALDHTVSTAPLTNFGKQLVRWPVVSLLFGAALCGYVHNTAAAIPFVFVALLLIIINTEQDLPASSLDYQVDQILPMHATVLRGAMTKTIPSHELVIGDIVQLSVGGIVPADIRLIEETHLATDDSLLLGSDRHNHKFIHAMSSSAALAQRHNLVWLGTRIVSGEATGIVVATGLHTELGRLLVLSKAASPHRSLLRTLEHTAAKPLVVTSATLAVVAAIGQLAGQLASSVTLEIFAVLATLLAIPGVTLTLAGLNRRAGRILCRFGITSAPSSRLMLANIDMALLDETDFITARDLEVSEFLIGKQTWHASGHGYDPTGQIMTSRGRHATKQQLADLQLFFEAAVLSSRAALLKPDAEHPDWHVAGQPPAGAALTIAARAGLDIAELRARYPEVHHHAYDASRQLTSTIRRYDHRTLAFGQGAASRVLECSNRIWDAGHTHALNAAERRRLQDYVAEQTAAGRHVIGLAYRTVAKADNKAEAASLEQNLTLLGLVSVATSLQPGIQTSLQRLQHRGVAVNVFSTTTPDIAAAIAVHAGLSQPTTLTDHQLAALAETQVAAALERGNVVFCGLSPDSRLRLIDIARRAGHHVVTTGRSLQDVPALKHAAISMSTPQIPAAVQGETTIILHEATGLDYALQAGRRLQSTVLRMIQGAAADTMTLLWLIACAIVCAWLWNIPPALTAPLALVIVSFGQFMPLIALGRQHAIQAKRRSTPAIYGLVAALITTTLFLACFAHAGLNPRFVVNDSRPYQEAVTLAFVALAGYSWLNALFAYGMTSLARRNILHVIIGVASAIAFVSAVLYVPALQTCFGSVPLTTFDWFLVFSGWALYGLCRTVGWHAHHHSRHEVIQLHKQIHSARSPNKA